jgi:very-short-patch-repair endonuclease
MTNAERRLWRLLRESFAQHRFRRQVPIRHFIADFASHRAKLVVEVDGGQHNAVDDAARTSIIEDEGYRVIRFWNHEVLCNPGGVWTVINTALRKRAGANPLPSMGRGRGGVMPDVEWGSKITPTQPSPIEGEG